MGYEWVWECEISKYPYKILELHTNSHSMLSLVICDKFHLKSKNFFQLLWSVRKLSDDPTQLWKTTQWNPEFLNEWRNVYLPHNNITRQSIIRVKSFICKKRGMNITVTIIVVRRPQETIRLIRRAPSYAYHFLSFQEKQDQVVHEIKGKIRVKLVWVEGDDLLKK